YLDARTRDFLRELIVKWQSNFRMSSAIKTRTPPLFRIGGQCELRNQQYLAVYFTNRKIHFAVGIFKDPQLDNFRSITFDQIQSVPFFNTKKYNQTLPD